MHLQWSEIAWSEYVELQSIDKIKIKRINNLIKEAMINAILEEFILIKLHKKLLTGGNS